MDFAAVNRQIDDLERRIDAPAEISPNEQLFVGVDLGTAYIVVVVVNAEHKPVACALEFAQVVRDGLVVDYTGATRIVRKLVQELEQRLGRELELAAIAVPPGTGERECATHRHVVEGAGLTVTSILDEPTAANAVLGVENGVIVDIGGGTTGLSVLENGKVVYVADEPTGGTHLSLVLAGNYGISFEEAEAIFYFQMNGCLSINKVMLRNHCSDWKKIQRAIDQFIRAGLESFLIRDQRDELLSASANT